MLCDTSGLLAYFDDGEALHRSVLADLEADGGPLIVSPYVIAELDYLVATRYGVEAELAVLRELTRGAWELARMDTIDLRHATEQVTRYADQNIGAADASLIVLGARYGTDRVLTLDHRHFGVLRTVTGAAFQVLPA